VEIKNQKNAEKGRPFFGIAFLIALFSLLLNVYGIRWGVPDDERLKLAFGGRENLKRVLDELPPLQFGNGKRAQFETDEEKVKRTSYYDLLRTYHSDEFFLLQCVANLDPSRADFNPDFFKYPSFHIYLVAGALKAASALHLIRIKSDVTYYLLNPSEFGKFYIVVRALTAAMAASCVLLVAYLGRRIFSRRCGLLGALFLGFMPIWALHAHFAKVDIPAVFWMLLGLLILFRYLDAGGKRWLYIGAAVLGLSASTKYTSILAFVFVPTVLIYEAAGIGLHWKKNLLSRKLALAAVFFFLAFALTSPFVLISFRDVLYHVGSELTAQSGARRGFQVFLGMFGNYGRFIKVIGLTMGWGILVLSAAGMLLAFFKKEKYFPLIFPFAALYFLLVGLTYLNYPNYMLPVIPFLTLMAAYLATDFVDRLRGRKVRRALAIAVVMLMVIYNGLFTLTYDDVMSMTDIRKEASVWIEKNIPEGSSIGIMKYPVIYRMPTLRHDYFALAVMAEDKDVPLPDYFILTSDVSSEPGRHLKYIEGNYRLLKHFEIDTRLLWIRFPSLSRNVKSGLGHIAPWISIYEKVEGG